MPLPTSRNQTFTDLEPILPETMHDIQDQIIGLHQRAQDTFYPSPRWFRNGGTKPGGWVQGFSEAYVSARLRPGTAIASISFRVRSPNGDGISFYVYEPNANGYTGVAPVAIFEGLQTAGVDSTYTLAMPANYVQPSGNVALELLVISEPTEQCRLYSATINIVEP